MTIRNPIAVHAAAIAMLTAPFGAHADSGWFVDLAVGNGTTEFEPLYTFVAPRPPRRFSDDDEDWVASLGGGYRHDINASVSVDFAAELIGQGAEWTLYIPSDPSSFKYDIPQTLAVRVSPSWEFTRGWRLFADLGLARGQVRERKSSPVSSSYRFDDWVGATLVGGGISYDVDEKISLSLAYAQLRFDSLTYRSYLPNGSHSETIKDSPVSSLTRFGVTYRF